MLRVITKLKSFKPSQSSIPTPICVEISSRVLQAAPSTLPRSDFIKECQALSIPELRQRQPKDAGLKCSLSEYLKGDPDVVEALVPTEISKHRSSVMEFLSREKDRKCGHTHVLILAGAELTPGFHFRQRSEFLHLCDCLVPGMLLVVLRNRKMVLHTVLCEPRREQQLDDKLAEIACQRYQVDQLLTLPQLKQLLCRRCNHSSVKLWFSLEKTALSKYIQELSEQLRLPIDCPRQLLEYARSFKTPQEMEVIRRSHRIAAQSMQQLIAEHAPRQSMEQMRALFAYKCQLQFAHQPLPFEPKCYKGSGQLWLMNAACQYAGYCGILARTWPISGRFTPPQKVIYNMLLGIRDKLFYLCGKRENIVHTPRELHVVYLTLLGEQLMLLGVLPSTIKKSKELQKAAAGFTCFPSSIKHVGLDLQESSEQLLDYPLKPGNVLAFQLSICIPQTCHQAYPEFRGIYCVLADSIHITEQHQVELLTEDCSSVARDVEQLRTGCLRMERFAN
ncbi:xaa-Pro aminopeptidase 3 [Drosophila albomicans]|uniref:Xaa-Pro aminopeptidase 3 n=1 Tax=Drosophila albomicans TaxID=7291 RepID=A0A6P8WWL3_DROAB|nr:xaa-Pro aminopeptidase 3 [Drosophila albomicans]